MSMIFLVVVKIFCISLQSNNEKLLENPYLQMRGLLQLSNE